MILRKLFLMALLASPLPAVADKSPEILILGEEISDKHNSSFLEIIPVQTPDQTKTVVDLLKKQKGVFIKTQSGPGSLSTINIRGIGAGKAEQVLILLDGVRLNTAQGNGVDLSRIPLSIVEKIEIIRGGESALYGSDAIGGVINIVTRKYKSQLTYSFSKKSWNFNDHQFSTTFGNSLGSFSFLISAHSQKTPGDYPFKHPLTHEKSKRTHNQFCSHGMLVKTQWAPSKSYLFSATQEYFYGNHHIPGSLTWLTNDLQKDHRWLTSFGLKKSISKDQYLSLLIALRKNILNYKDPFGKYVYENAHIGPKVFFVSPFGEKNLLQTVGEASFDLSKSPFVSNKKSTFALAIKDDFFMSSLWTWTPVIRVEHAAHLYTVATPKLGMTYKLSQTSPDLLIKSNFSNSFRSPSFDELYFDFPFFKGNPRLKPEKSWDGDFGFSYQNSYFKAENSFFASLIKNLISQKRLFPQILSLENRDKNFLWGHEISAESLLPLFYSLYGSINYTWIKTNGLYSAEHTINSALSWKESFFTISLDHQYVSSQKTPEILRPKLFPAHIFSGEISFNPLLTKITSSPIMLQLSIENIFNRSYERIAFYPMPGRIFSLGITGTL